MSSRGDIEMTGGGGVSHIATLKKYVACLPTFLNLLMCH